MSRRRALLLSGVGGVFWTFVVLSTGQQITVPIALIQPALMGAVFAPGIVLAIMIARIALRRYFSNDLTDNQSLAKGSDAEIDARVLQNTVEQIVLALCIWPLVGFSLGAGTVLTLGLGFALARLIYWVGCHQSPAMRLFGSAATFLPTVLAGLWVLARLVTR